MIGLTQLQTVSAAGISLQRSTALDERENLLLWGEDFLQWGDGFLTWGTEPQGIQAAAANPVTRNGIDLSGLTTFSR